MVSYITAIVVLSIILSVKSSLSSEKHCCPIMKNIQQKPSSGEANEILIIAFGLFVSVIKYASKYKHFC